MRGVAHNFRVTDANLDPPQTFSAAEAKFGTFLATQNHPKAICWVMPGDVVVTSRHYWVRRREVELAVRLYWMMRKEWDFGKLTQFGSRPGKPGTGDGVK